MPERLSGRGEVLTPLTEEETARVVAKIGDEGPTVLDVITGGEVDLVINTMSNVYEDPGEGGGPVIKDGFEIRRAAVERRIPCLTSLDTAAALTAYRHDHAIESDFFR